MKQTKRKLNKRLKKIWKFVKEEEKKIVNVIYVALIFFCLLFSVFVYVTSQRITQDLAPMAFNQPPSHFENKIKETVQGYPIERMTPYLARKDRKVATFLIAIAKKESNWGKLSPKKNGRECWNFWGYRGPENPTPSGYSCFNSPRQAVQVVGDRIADFIDQDLDTPREMAVWKCGYDCSWDNPAQVNKWVADVGYYYKKIYE